MSNERNLKTAWVHHYGSTHGYDKAIERVRQAVLVEVADRADSTAVEWARRSHIEASNALTLFAESLRPGIDAHTPQNGPGAGSGS